MVKWERCWGGKDVEGMVRSQGVELSLELDPDSMRVYYQEAAMRE